MVLGNGSKLEEIVERNLQEFRVGIVYEHIPASFHLLLGIEPEGKRNEDSLLEGYLLDFTIRMLIEILERNITGPEVFSRPGPPGASCSLRTVCP